MRALPVVVVLGLLTGCSSSGPTALPTAGASGRVRVLSDCEHPTVRPTEILIACGDGSYWLTDIRYTAWDDTSARGSATAMANDFTPNRATARTGRTP